jgi:hypothetical protein
MGCASFQNLTRRDFFRIGGVGLFGLSAPTLLEARAAAPRAKQMIILWLGGGPPHIDMFDMKPDAPAEVRGPWKPIDTKLPGLQVSELSWTSSSNRPLICSARPSCARPSI